MESFACLMWILVLIGPLVGLFGLCVSVPGLLARRLAQPRCFFCGYDEKGRSPDAACPECGKFRKDAPAFTTKRKPVLVLWPLLPAFLGALAFGYAARGLNTESRVFAGVCLVAPFIWLAIVGMVSSVTRRPALAWVCVGIPAILALGFAAYWFAEQVNLPVAGSEYPDYRELGRQLSFPAFAVFVTGIMGWLHAVVAAVLVFRLPRWSADAPVDDPSPLV